MKSRFSQQGDGSLFAMGRQDREFCSTCLNIENSIAGISLREDHFILWILQDCSSQSSLGKKCLRIKFPCLARRHRTLRSGNPNVTTVHPRAAKSHAKSKLLSGARKYRMSGNLLSCPGGQNAAAQPAGWPGRALKMFAVPSCAKLSELEASPVRQISIETAQSSLDCSVLAKLPSKTTTPNTSSALLPGTPPTNITGLLARDMFCLPMEWYGSVAWLPSRPQIGSSCRLPCHIILGYTTCGLWQPFVSQTSPARM